MRIVTVFLAVLLMAGCSFSAPGVRGSVGDTDDVHIDVGGGSHCPPGHKKKGSC